MRLIFPDSFVLFYKLSTVYLYFIYPKKIFEPSPVGTSELPL